MVYCLDSQFVSSATKFIAGVMQTLSAMVLLEVPHVSVLTKLDICPDRDAVERLAMPDGQTLVRAREAVLVTCHDSLGRHGFSRVQ